MLADDELKMLLMRDWAVRVLDAWAGTGGLNLGSARRWSTDSVGACALCEWAPRRTDHGSIDLVRNDEHSSETPDDARLKAARAIFPDLPESVRRELGECPNG